MNVYTVSISNTFAAEDERDAINQMIAYLVDYADVGGYRVDDEYGNSVFIDAELDIPTTEIG